MDGKTGETGAGNVSPDRFQRSFREAADRPAVRRLVTAREATRGRFNVLAHAGFQPLLLAAQATLRSTLKARSDGFSYAPSRQRLVWLPCGKARDHGLFRNSFI